MLISSLFGKLGFEALLAFSIGSSFGNAIRASCLFSSVCSVAKLIRAAASRDAFMKFRSGIEGKIPAPESAG